MNFLHSKSDSKDLFIFSNNPMVKIDWANLCISRLISYKG